MTESHKQLYSTLIETEIDCVPPGLHETTEVYEIVQETYPGLCDDSVLCRDVCGADNNQPEWKHRVRTVQQDLLRDEAARVQSPSNGWYYSPTALDVASIPDSESNFEVGSYYNRWELHDVVAGQRYSGISRPADRQTIFIFTGESGEEYGYEDEFRDDGTFMYSDEGAEGDMEIADGSEAIRSHRSNNESLHLFEDTEYPWIVSYVGQYQYVGHEWKTLEDRDDDEREAIRFRLEPVGGTEIEIEDGTPGSLSEGELFEKAKRSSPASSSSVASTSSSGTGRQYSRSEVVKEFALRHADGVCQGCEEEAPFEDSTGDPFLEVHHLHRRSDGGTDDPENVIALCPNCHRRRHVGKDGDEFNKDLIEKAEQRNHRLRNPSSL
jgi:5-methylcytosine-specific restriction protein A